MYKIFRVEMAEIQGREVGTFCKPQVDSKLSS